MEKQEVLPQGWCWARLESLTERIGDVDHKMPSAVASGIPYISTKNFYGENGIDFDEAKRISPEDYGTLCRKIKPAFGDILLSRYGTVGEIRKVTADVEFQASYSIAIVKTLAQPNLTNYLVYALRSEVVQTQIKRDIRATAQPDLGLEYIRRFDIPLAPLSEQHRIVSAIEQQFTRLDAGVAALKRAQVKLKRYRATVLKAAVAGNLTEVWRAEHPATEPASILLERILKERRARWEGDLKAKGRDPAKVKYVEPAKPDIENLPELPEEWCWASFEQISERVTVGHVGLMRDEYIDNGIPFLRSQNVRPNYFDQNGLKFISYEFHRKLSKSALETGDILVVRSGSVGVACVMPNIFEEANCSDLVIVKQPINVNPHYAAYYMNSTAQDRVRAEQVGIALTHFNTRSMAAMPLPLPPIAEQEQMVSEVERRLSVVTQLEAIVEANLKRAERLRQSILKEAFAGRLVPQDPTDEPASVLLESIRKEREGRKKGIVGNGRYAKVSSEPVQIDVEGTRQVELWEGV